MYVGRRGHWPVPDHPKTSSRALLFADITIIIVATITALNDI